MGSGSAPPLPGEGLGERWQERFGETAGLPTGERFHPQEMLGRGSHGEVVAMLDRTLDRRIAVKFFGVGADAERARSAVAEARMLARMDHPNVLPVYDLGIAQDGQPFIAMKAIEGQTLGTAILAAAGGQPSPVAQAHAVVAIGIQVCQAVGYAHHRGVIHQDLKPDNIMLGAFGEVLVMDWGCATAVGEDGSATGPAYGTPLYMSPEQARERRATRQSDVYAIGATLFHALVHRPPLWLDDAEVFWRAKQAGEIQEPTPAERARVPAALLAVVRKALEADPARRYPSVDALRQDLERYQSGLAVAAYPDALWGFLVRAYRRHRSLSWAMAAVVALAGCAGALAWRHHRLEQTSWRLVVAEDFDRPLPALARDWQVVGRDLGVFRGAGVPQPQALGPESWQPMDGGMAVQAQHLAEDLVWRHDVPGALRVSWEYVTHEHDTNLNCFLGSDRVGGYTFHVGGWGHPDQVILTHGEAYTRLAWAPVAPLALDVPHRFVLERTSTHLALAIDGRQVIDYAALGGMDAPDRDTFGFDAYDNRLTVRHVRIEVQSPARLVSPLAVPDALYHLGAFAPALAHYEAIGSSYPDSDLALRARFGSAMCRSALREDAAAGAALDAFVQAAPDHPYAPFADWERLRIADRTNDRARAEAALADLGRFRGSQLLMAVLSEHAEAMTVRAMPHGVYADPEPVSPALIPALERALLDLRHWGEVDGVNLADTRLFTDGQDRLLRVGDAAFVLAQAREQWAIDLARYCLGRLPDLIRDPQTGEGSRIRALLESGHLDDPRLAPAARRDGLLDLEMRLLTTFVQYREPGTPQQQQYIAQRRAIVHHLSEQAVAHPRPEWRTNDPFAIYPRYLVDANREDQVLTEAGEYQAATWTVCLRRLWRGDADADALLDHLAARPWDVDVLRETPIVTGALAVVEALVPVLRAHDRDPSVAVPPRLAATLPLLDQIACRQGAYVVRAILGTCTEAEFLAQPNQVLLDARLGLAQGVRAELAGDRITAVHAYQRIPPWIAEPDLLAAFAQWRRTVLGDPTAQPPPPRP